MRITSVKPQNLQEVHELQHDQIPLICPIYCSSIVRREEHSVWWWTLLGTLCIVDTSWDTLEPLGKPFSPLMRVLYG